MQGWQSAQARRSRRCSGQSGIGLRKTFTLGPQQLCCPSIQEELNEQLEDHQEQLPGNARVSDGYVCAEHDGGD